MAVLIVTEAGTFAQYLPAPDLSAQVCPAPLEPSADRFVPHSKITHRLNPRVADEFVLHRRFVRLEIHRHTMRCKLAAVLSALL